MTEGTAITMLDCSKPPPGYRISGPPSHKAQTAAAIAEAWTNYKAEHDPPGMWSGQARGEHDGGYGFATMDVDHEDPIDADFERIDDARAAAWAWHDRRQTLVLILAAQMAGFLDREAAADLLAKALAWTEADCAEMDIFLHTPCPEGVNPYREGPACLMLAVWGPSWKPPAVNRFAPAAPPASVVDTDQLEPSVTGLKVTRRFPEDPC